MQYLANNNPNRWSDHHTKQINNFIDHYIEPPQTHLLEEIPEFLDYADYDLDSVAGSHFSGFQL
jgi:hypothetical protein